MPATTDVTVPVPPTEHEYTSPVAEIQSAPGVVVAIVSVAPVVDGETLNTLDVVEPIMKYGIDCAAAFTARVAVGVVVPMPTLEEKMLLTVVEVA